MLLKDKGTCLFYSHAEMFSADFFLAQVALNYVFSNITEYLYEKHDF